MCLSCPHCGTNIESNTKRMDFKVKELTTRLMYEGNLNKDNANWLNQPGEPRVHVTVDVNNKTKSAHLNRIDATPTGKGFGFEALQFVISDLKRRGFKEIMAYVEHFNVNSQSMFRKAGFKKNTDRTHGAYWEMSLE